MASKPRYNGKPQADDCTKLKAEYEDWLKWKAAHDAEEYKHWTPARPTPHDPFGRRQP